MGDAQLQAPTSDLEGSSTLDTPANFESVAACMLCHSTERTLCFADPPFQVIRCSDCGLVYVTPRLRPEMLGHVYDDGYWRSASPSERGYSDYAADAALYHRTFRKRMDFLERFVPGPGRALDVGCAAGFFLHVLRERGWEADGVEPSAAICSHAQQVAGPGRVHPGRLEDAPFEAGSYDLVTLWDVVEHVPDPRSLLRRARAMLRSGGHLVLETQNVKSTFARLLGRRWQHYKHLEHLYHFGPETLARLLAEAGLETVASTPRHAGKHVSLAFIRERAGRLHPALRPLLKPLAPLDRIQAYVNFGDEVIVVARRKDDDGPRAD